MSSQEPIKPGDIRFRIDGQQNLVDVAKPKQKARRLSAQFQFLAVVLTVAVFAVGSMLSRKNFDQLDIRTPIASKEGTEKPVNPVAATARVPRPANCETALDPQGPGPCYIKIPSRPVRPGKYLSFSLSSSTGARVLVFAYVSLHIVALDPTMPVPSNILSTSTMWPDETSANLHRRTESLSTQAPLLVQGNVDIDFGPIIGADDLETHLGLRDSKLKEIFVTFAQSPRGPPSQLDSKPKTRLVYVYGKINSFKGPTQRDHSTFRAQIDDLADHLSSSAEFSLGPNSNEEEVYLKRYKAWRKEVEPIAEEYHVPKDRLESPNTSRGLLDVSAPTAPESKPKTDLVSPVPREFRPIERPKVEPRPIP
jgi:hypothetical protein